MLGALQHLINEGEKYLEVALKIKEAVPRLYLVIYILSLAEIKFFEEAWEFKNTLSSFCFMTLFCLFDWQISKHFQIE